MEKFIKKLKLDIILGIIFIASTFIAQALLWFVLPEMKNGIAKHFISGFLVGLSFVIIYFVIRNIIIIKDKNKLLELYTKENDERRKSIELFTSKSGYKITLNLLSIAMIFSICINKYVGFTLIGVILLITGINFLTEIYYNKKM